MVIFIPSQFRDPMKVTVILFSFCCGDENRSDPRRFVIGPLGTFVHHEHPHQEMWDLTSTPFYAFPFILDEISIPAFLGSASF
jgi:hypothetical protein